MSAKNEQTLRRLVSSIKQADRSKTSGYDTQATVRRIEDGIAWVHIPGGVDETPVKLTIAAAPGDTVQVRVSGGRAFLVGNATAPPTDDTTAKKAVSQIGVVNKAVKAVQRIAEQAARIAGNTNQYFWHTQEGTDTGAHITEIPQEDFLRDPENGGGNLLLRSTGIAIRDGLKEVATFARNGMSFVLPNRNAYEDAGEVLLKRENVGELGSLWVSNLYGKWAALRSIDGNASLWGKTASIFAPKVTIANLAPASRDIDPEDCEVEISGTLTALNIGAVKSATSSNTISTAGIDTYTQGPSITLPAGVWVVTGQWVFQTGSSSGARNMGVQLSPTSGSSASGAYKLVRVNAASAAFASLDITDIITLTSTTTIYLKAASSMTYTTATTNTIKAVRIK